MEESMSTKRTQTPKKKTRSNPLTISCRAPSAQAVFVTGTFSDWEPDAIPLLRGDDGEWSVALDLAPGRYEFKFVVDGVWCCEPGRGDEDPSGECVPNSFGTMNRVLEVAAPKKPAARAR